MVLRDWPIVYQFILLKTRLSMQYNYLCIFKLAHFLGSFWFPAVKSLFANPYKIFLFPWSQFFVTWAQFPVRLFSPSDIRKNCPTTFYCIFQLIWVLMTTTHIRMCFRSFYIILFSYGSPLWIHLNFLIPKGGPLWKKCFIEAPETALIFCEPISIKKCNKKWWDSSLVLSLGLNSLPWSCVGTGSHQCLADKIIHW